MRLSVIIPCLNEEKTIGKCVKKAREAIKKYGAKGEVIVVDNSSVDKSARRARSAGAKVLFEKRFEMFKVRREDSNLWNKMDPKVTLEMNLNLRELN